MQRVINKHGTSLQAIKVTDKISQGFRHAKGFALFLLLSTSILLSLAATHPANASECNGRFVNPITDICWACLFPLSIGSMKVFNSSLPDTPNPSNPVCYCNTPHPRVGITLGYWEPFRLADVTRKPFCLVSLGGVSINVGHAYSQGNADNYNPGNDTSFYYVHWYKYPLIYWLNILTDAMCLEKGDFDIAYLTELDPLWRDDELSFIINPEAAIFANPIAQNACAADCTASSLSLPRDNLFWCAGCQGSMYPLDGNVAEHVGGVQASTLLVERMTYKLHREGALWGTLATSSSKALCQPYLMPIMKKSQYRYQMTYPKPAVHVPNGCQPYGHTTVIWGAGREYPVKGEDFGYLIWRKRSCCAA